MKVTSAYANKMLRQLNEEKEYWLTKERNSCTYVVAVDEEPVIPEYDYQEVTAKIDQIDEKIVAIKHAINFSNATNQIDVNGRVMTVDQILVRMAQVTKRKEFLDRLRRNQPKSRKEPGYGARTLKPEYQYINYDLGLIRQEFDRVSGELMEMQLALDRYNQTVEFDVEV